MTECWLNWTLNVSLNAVCQRIFCLANKVCCNRPLGSISPTFYVQLLPSLIPNAQKDSQIKQLFALLGYRSVKAARKMLMKSTPDRSLNLSTSLSLIIGFLGTSMCRFLFWHLTIDCENFFFHWHQGNYNLSCKLWCFGFLQKKGEMPLCRCRLKQQKTRLTNICYPQKQWKIANYSF